MQHDFRDASRCKNLNRGEIPRTVRQRIDQTRDQSVDPDPIVQFGGRQSGGMRNSRDMEQHIGGTAERSEDQHGVFQGLLRHDVSQRDVPRRQTDQRQRGSTRHVDPYRFPRRRQGAMRQSHAEGFGHDLGGCGGAEEVTAAACGSAAPASHSGCIVPVDHLMREPRSQRLDLGGVFGVVGGQHGAAGHDDAGQIPAARQGHHHRGKSFVAGGDPHHSFSSRQRANEPAHHHGGVIAIGEAVVHAFGPLRASVARIAAETGERKHTLLLEGHCRLLDQQADFPVP